MPFLNEIATHRKHTELNKPNNCCALFELSMPVLQSPYAI